MSYIKLIVIVFFFLHGTRAEAQVIHEVKLDFSTFFGKKIVPQYEAVLSDRVGIEVALELDRSDDGFVVFGMSGVESFQYSALKFNPSIGGKYYFSPKKRYGYGFFVGPYIRLNYLLSRDENYATKYEEVFNVQATEFITRDSGLKSFNAGLHGGYKFLIKSKFIIELVSHITANKITQGDNGEFGNPAVFDFETIFIKFGYRF